MPNAHRYTNRNYRPSDEEYDPAKATAESAGHTMNAVVRALLRHLNGSPGKVMREIEPHLRAIAGETAKGGRKRKQD